LAEIFLPACMRTTLWRNYRLHACVAHHFLDACKSGLAQSDASGGVTRLNPI
jgi:hypothetical protein